MICYEDAMSYMEGVSKYGSVLGLKNTKELMMRLGNPQDKLRFVHVAGTNGKGSTCTYIASILKEAGYKVGRYVSPTIFGYLERIQVDSIWMLPDDFVKLLSKVKNAVDAMVEEGLPHPTAFEIETAVAFLEFVDKNCDLVILEVGLGGRLDATNVIKNTICAVITSISMDHMAILGDTIEQIAREKAGIIKRGVPVVSHEQSEEVRKILQQVCQDENSILKIVNHSEAIFATFSLDKTVFSYSSELFAGKMELETSILGKYQIKNALTAIETASILKQEGFIINRGHVINGIRNARWEGRFSVVHKHPYIIVDGAHNEDAAISLNESTTLYFNEKPLIRIIGIFKDKEYEKIIANTVRENDTVITIRPNNERGLDSDKLAECANKYCNRVFNGESVEHALKIAMELANEEDVILAYGSLSFLHEVYAFIQNKSCLSTAKAVEVRKDGN